MERSQIEAFVSRAKTVKDLETAFLWGLNHRAELGPHAKYFSELLIKRSLVLDPSGGK